MWRALVTIPGCGLASSNRNALKWPRLPSIASEAIAVSRSARSASSRAAPDGHAGERAHERRAVGEREPLLGLEQDRLEAELGQHVARGVALDAVERDDWPSPASARPT